MQFDQESVGVMAAEIWNSMLGIELVPLERSEPISHEERTLTGCVQITGEWQGAVTVCCPVGLAKTFAGAMFMSDPDGLENDEVRDALGELTNMTGGVVKGMVPGDCQLGIPAVAEGVDYTFVIPKGIVVSTIGFHYEGAPVEIVIYETK